MSDMGRHREQPATRPWAPHLPSVYVPTQRPPLTVQPPTDHEPTRPSTPTTHIPREHRAVDRHRAVVVLQTAGIGVLGGGTVALAAHALGIGLG